MKKKKSTEMLTFEDYYQLLRTQGWHIILSSVFHLTVCADKDNDYDAKIRCRGKTPTKAIKKVYDYIMEKDL